VTVYTDGTSTVLFTLPEATKGILAHWYLRIACFLPTLKLEYKPGCANVVANTLSRVPAAVTSGTNEILLVSDGTPVSGGSDTHNNLQLV